MNDYGEKTRARIKGAYAMLLKSPKLEQIFLSGIRDEFHADLLKLFNDNNPLL